ncbi:hypothetical protein VSR82_21765 [Burkholderia sp. JPY481]
MKISDLKRFDAAEDLDTSEDRALFLDGALDEDDPRVLPHMLAIVARSCGRADLLATAGRAGELSIFELRALLGELGLEMTFRAKAAPAA